MNSADYYEANARFLEPALKEELNRVEPEGVDLPRFIGQYNLRPQGGIVIVFGFVGGHIKELLSVLGFKEKIVVIECSLARFKGVLSGQNLVAILSAPNLELIVGRGVEGVVDSLKKILSFDKLNKVIIIEYPHSLDHNFSYYQKIKDLLKNSLDMRRANLEAFGVFARMWVENMLTNLEEIIRNPPIDCLFGQFSHHPAIIISAGPSLDKNIAELSRAKGRALLICVGSALKPSLSQGIRPDLIVDVDARPKHLKKFEGINEDARDIALAADPILYPPILKMFKGLKLIASYGHPIMDWIQSHLEFGDLEFSTLRTGGSASTVAFDLARRMGADPIIFIGLDLSFSGDNIYAQGAHLDERLKRGYLEDGSFLMEDVEGKQVATNRRMALYLKWLEDEIAHTSSTCINATEGGVLKKGVILMELSRAIDEYCQKTLKIEDFFDQARAYRPDVEIDSLKKDMEGFIYDFSQLEKICDDAQVLIKEGSSWERLEEINRKIDHLGATRLINEIIEGALWQISLQAKDEEMERFSFLYETIKEVSQKMGSLMKEKISKL